MSKVRHLPPPQSGQAIPPGAPDEARAIATASDYTRAMAATHSTAVGYVIWIFGFMGSHRFYFGKPLTGTLYFFTLGLLGIGWIVDLFLIPAMSRNAELEFRPGAYDYTLAWVLLTFLGVLGIHRFYLGKWVTGLLYLVSGGLVGLGLLYDYWTLNATVSESNAAA